MLICKKCNSILFFFCFFHVTSTHFTVFYYHFMWLTTPKYCMIIKKTNLVPEEWRVHLNLTPFSLFKVTFQSLHTHIHRKETLLRPLNETKSRTLRLINTLKYLSLWKNVDSVLYKTPRVLPVCSLWKLS